MFLPGGNLPLVAALARGVPVMYSCQATLVEYAEREGVVVHTGGRGVGLGGGVFGGAHGWAGAWEAGLFWGAGVGGGGVC